MNCTTESAIYVMELSEFHLWVLPLVTWIDGFPQPEYCMLHSLGIKDCGTHRTAACINGNLTLTHRTDFFCVKLEKVKYVGRNSMRSSMERLLRHKKHKPSFIHTLRYFCRTIYGKGFITHSINQIKLFPSDILIFIQHGDPMLRIRNP
jgi:hypothetical protein